MLYSFLKFLFDFFLIDAVLVILKVFYMSLCKEVLSWVLICHWEWKDNRMSKEVKGESELKKSSEKEKACSSDETWGWKKGQII